MDMELVIAQPDITKSISSITGGSIWDSWLDADALNLLVNHPLLLNMQKGRLSLNGVRYFLVQHHHYSRNFTRFLCAIINRLESLGDIKHLMENMQEEMGIDGDNKVTHAELFQRTLRAVGTHPMAEKALPETVDFTQTIMQFSRATNPVEGLAALCMGAEAIVPLIYKPVLQALERLNISDEGLEFFRLHIEEDEDHAITMLGILGELTQHSPEAKALAKQIGREAILKRCVMFDAIWKEVSQESFTSEDEPSTESQDGYWLDKANAGSLQLPQRLLHVAVSADQDARSATTAKVKSHAVDLPVQTMRMSVEHLAPEEQTRLHRINYERVLYVLAGTGSTFIEDKVLHWEAGDAIYVPAWARHYHANNQQSASFIACENSPQLTSLGRIMIREEL